MGGGNYHPAVVLDELSQLYIIVDQFLFQYLLHNVYLPDIGSSARDVLFSYEDDWRLLTQLSHNYRDVHKVAAWQGPHIPRHHDALCHFL